MAATARRGRHGTRPRADPRRRCRCPRTCRRRSCGARSEAELIDAAERLFSTNGFDATSLGAVADAAGYTKGAVYSNFASKEALFFAVYERRVERHRARVEEIIATDGVAAGMKRIVADVSGRRAGHDDGWLTVFLEFRTHVLRHPEHRARFAEIHARAVEPAVAHLEALAASRGVELPVPGREAAVALFAMQTGLSLERLTQPDVVSAAVGERMFALWLELLVGDREAPAERTGAPDEHAV